jgi:hypothetical protein
VQLVSVTPAAGATVPTVRVRIATILCAALFLLLLTNVGNISLGDLGGRTAPIFFSDLGVVAVVVVGAMAAGRARSLHLSDAALAGVAFACIGALAAVGSMATYGLGLFETVTSLAYLARWVVYFALYVVIINSIREHDVHSVWSALELTILLFASFGIVQSVFLPDFGLMLRPEDIPYAQTDPQGHRLVSTVLEPNIAAAMILIVLLVQLAQLAYGLKISWWKPAILFTALVLTMSRSGALGFLVGVLVIVSAQGIGKRLLKFGAAALVLAAATLPLVVPFFIRHSRFGFSDESALARLVIWQRAIELWRDHVWFGIGFNTYGFVQEARGFTRFGSSSYSAEGGLLFVGVMTGIVGLATYVIMLGLIVRRCRAGWRSPRAFPQERALCLGAAAATIAILIHSIFVNSLLVNFVMQELWVLWGLTFVVVAAMRRRA